MKKLLLTITVLLLFAVPAMAIDWVGTNQATIAWDAVTTIGDDPIPAGDTISYRVYTKLSPDGPEVVAGDTPALQYTLTFTAEGRYLAGVRTVRVPQGETDEIVSDILWSDSTDVVAVPDQFGFVHYVPADTVKGFKPQTP